MTGPGRGNGGRIAFASRGTDHDEIWPLLVRDGEGVLAASH